MSIKKGYFSAYQIDFAKCFKFYTEQLGLEPAWGDENSGYGDLKKISYWRPHYIQWMNSSDGKKKMKQT